MRIKLCVLIMLSVLSRSSMGFAANSIIDGSKRLAYDGAYIIASPLRMDKQGVKKFLLFSGISYGLMTAEPEIRERVKGNEKIGRLLGKDDNWFKVCQAIYLYELLPRDKDKENHLGSLLIEAMVIDGVITSSIKIISGRYRPYQVPAGVDNDLDDFHPFSGHLSFPSGHTSAAFTIAAVMSDQYTSNWIRVPIYTIAGLVGIQRIHGDAHGAMDVFAGAVLGMQVGRTVCNLDKKWTSGDIRFSSDGIRLLFRF